MCNNECCSGNNGSTSSGSGSGSQITYVSSVSVCPKSITLKVGSWSYAASASVYPFYADNTDVYWRSDNPSIASVNSSSGYIYANAIGTARIYAIASDGSGCRDYLTVTVNNKVSVTSVTLRQSNISIEEGQSVSLFATVCPDNASNTNLNWTSSNNSIATVNNGVVTAIAKGSARITVTAADGSGKSDVCNVTVTRDILVTSVRVSPSSKTMTVGDSAFLNAVVCPEDATMKTVCWSSSNVNIVSVNETSGLVVAQNVGKATVYATACDGSGVVGYCSITVSPPIMVENINVRPSTIAVDVGDTAVLSAEVYPTNAKNKLIRWTSENDDIADVDYVTGRITAKAQGTTFIWANAQDGSGVCTGCEVVVTLPCCSTNSTMENAQLIAVESLASGNISLTDSVQWFKFTVPQTATYTIYTTGELDTVGWLYDSNGILICQVDDHEACGKANFRIIEELQGNETYYIQVAEANSNAGSYQLKVTQNRLVDSIAVSPATIVLDVDKTYELPILPNTFTGVNGAEPLSDLAASTVPAIATEKKVLWQCFDSDVVRISTGWYNGQRYQTLTPLAKGIVTIYAYDWNEHGKRGECTVYVGGAPVTSVALNYNSLAIRPDNSEILDATVFPQNAMDKNVEWSSSNTKIVTVNQYGCIYAKSVGTAVITACTTDGRFTAECVVTVMNRLEVIIEEDNEDGEKFFKITFPINEGGLVWKSVGYELFGENILIPAAAQQRSNHNLLQVFSAIQLAFVYLFDPLGVKHYLRCYYMTHEISLTGLCYFKDDVYSQIFGVAPQRFLIDDDGNRYTPNPALPREEVYSDAELVFGGHTILDVAELIKFGVELVLSLFEDIVPEPIVQLLQRGATLVDIIFFGGSIVDAFKEDVSSAVQGYFDSIKNDSVELLTWPYEVFDAINTVAEGLENSFKTLHASEITICNKVSKQSHYKVKFKGAAQELFMDDVLDLCSE